MSDDITKEINGLVAYILTSAAGCVNEPKIYGPMRLVDVANRLIELALSQGVQLDSRHKEIADRIKRDMLLCMDDEDGFVEMLNDVTLLVTDIVAEEE